MRGRNRFLLVLLATAFQQYKKGEVAAQTLSCACALAPSNHVINCDASTNQAVLNQAMTDLQTNGCDQGNNCQTNDACRIAYYLVQAHHDYCWADEVPSTLSSVFHTYEGTCVDCHVIRKYNPALPPCPQANCDGDAGKIAYEYLLSSDNNSCQEDCNRQDCAEAFRMLRAVYETCPDGTLHLIAELAVNDWGDLCAAVDCNTGSSDDPSSSQLTCDATDTASLITRPPAPLAATAVPTTTPPIACPRPPDDDNDRAYVVGDEGPVCEVCGAGRCMARPDEVFRWPNRPVIKCQDLQDAGLTGFISFDQCEALPALVGATCGCSPAGSYIPYVPPTNLTAGATAGTDEDERTKADPAGSSTTSSTKKDKFGAGVAVGIGAAIGLVALLVAGAFATYRNRAKLRARRHHQSKADDPTASAPEIEVAELRRPTEKQELA